MEEDAEEVSVAIGDMLVSLSRWWFGEQKRTEELFERKGRGRTEPSSGELDSAAFGGLSFVLVGEFLEMPKGELRRS